MGFGEGARRDPPPRIPTTTPRPQPTIYKTPDARSPGPVARGAQRSRTVRPAPPARALAPARPRPGVVPAVLVAAGRAGALSEPTGSPSAPRLLALNESRFQGPNTPRDSIQEGGGGASQGPVPSGLAPAAPASACQGARGYPLPTASPTARRTGRQAGRTDQQTPSS